MKLTKNINASGSYMLGYNPYSSEETLTFFTHVVQLRTGIIQFKEKKKKRSTKYYIMFLWCTSWEQLFRTKGEGKRRR